MKKVVIQAKPEIGWDKKRWVINYDNDVIVLTSGKHNGNDFSGTALPCEIYPKGDTSDYWDKRKFQPITLDIPFVISNSED